MTGLLCKNPRIVLILGTGYLGKALAESLRKAGHTALTADIDPQKAIYEADVADRASMQGLAARIPSPQIIVMCASTRGGGEEAYRNLYANGTRNTLEAFPGTPVIFCSSTAVYGITDGRWITEEHNVYPSSGKTGFLFRRNRRSWQREARSSGWEPCTGRAAVFSSPSTSRRGRPSPEPWTDGSITSTGTMPQPPCTCSAPCGNRLPAFTT